MKGWIGYLGLGGSVALKGGSVETAHVPNAGGGGCEWYAVEPRGYVCAGDAATIDPNDPAVKALAIDAPKTDSPWPYEYGESLGAPRYDKVPSASEQTQNEWYLDKHLQAVEAMRRGEDVSSLEKELLGVDVRPAGTPKPDLFAFGPLVREGRRLIATGSTVAYTRSFDEGARTFLLTHDQAIVPKDRVRPYPRSEFHGVELSGEVKLPIAFIRKSDKPKYKRDGATFTPTGASWARLATLPLTGERASDEKNQPYLETKEDGLWILEADAAVAAMTPTIPAWVRADAQGRNTWVDISVLGGTIVAYQGEKPVYATMISPGRGGIPYPNIDPLETASTPTGTFRVDGKFVTATMVSSTNDLLVHTEVQFIQNFHGPHALHGAYWHDRWGEPKSGGCVNLAPIDAKWMFHFSEPDLPEGWYGMRSVPENGPVTIVRIHK
jgi:hypothetical protein